MARLEAETSRTEVALEREAKLRREIAQMRFRPREDEPCNDTLQREIERLRTELLVANKESRNTEPFAAEYEELQKRAEDGRQKDLEIETLKLHVTTHFAELNQLREHMRKEEGGVTEEDLTFGMRTYQEDNLDDIADAENDGLRSLNEELCKQLELYKNESDDAKKSL